MANHMVALLPLSAPVPVPGSALAPPAVVDAAAEGVAAAPLLAVLVRFAVGVVVPPLVVVLVPLAEVLLPVGVCPCVVLVPAAKANISMISPTPTPAIPTIPILLKVTCVSFLWCLILCLSRSGIPVGRSRPQCRLSNPLHPATFL